MGERYRRGKNFDASGRTCDVARKSPGFSRWAAPLRPGTDIKAEQPVGVSGIVAADSRMAGRRAAVLLAVPLVPHFPVIGHVHARLDRELRRRGVLGPIHDAVADIPAG